MCHSIIVYYAITPRSHLIHVARIQVVSTCVPCHRLHVSCIGNETIVSMASRRHVSTCSWIRVDRPGYLYPVTCIVSGVNAALGYVDRWVYHWVCDTMPDLWLPLKLQSWCQIILFIYQKVCKCTCKQLAQGRYLPVKPVITSSTLWPLHCCATPLSVRYCT